MLMDFLNAFNDEQPYDFRMCHHHVMTKEGPLHQL